MLIDTTIFQDDNVGLGGIVRDGEGDIMAAMCKNLRGKYEVDVDAAMVAWFMLSTTLEAGLTR